MLEGPTLTYFTAEHGMGKGMVGDEACMACMGLRGGRCGGSGEGWHQKKPVCDSPFGASFGHTDVCVVRSHVVEKLDGCYAAVASSGMCSGRSGLAAAGGSCVEPTSRC